MDLHHPRLEKTCTHDTVHACLDMHERRTHVRQRCFQVTPTDVREKRTSAVTGDWSKRSGDTGVSGILVPCSNQQLEPPD